MPGDLVTQIPQRAFEIEGGVPRLELVGDEGSVPASIRDSLTNRTTLPA